MTIKPDMFDVNKESPLNAYPDSFRSDFAASIKKGVTPSKSLRLLMAQYSLKNIEPTVVYDLILAGYPGLEFYNISGWVYENHYPERTDLISDLDFDKAILEQVNNQPNW